VMQVSSMNLVILRHRPLKANDPHVSRKSADGIRWTISPDGSDEILQLEFEKEFGLLIDLSFDPEKS
jgi:hypothetical protein